MVAVMVMVAMVMAAEDLNVRHEHDLAVLMPVSIVLDPVADQLFVEVDAVGLRGRRSGERERQSGNCRQKRLLHGGLRCV